MEQVESHDVEAVIREKGLLRIGHHKCSMCGYPTGYVVDDGDVVAFDAGCDCTGRYVLRPASVEDIAATLNMQSPEVRARMWEDFQAGKPLID
jgi:hypothetical protein